MSFLIYPREEITNSGGKGGDNRWHRRPFKRRGNNGPEKEERQNPKWTDSGTGGAYGPGGTHGAGGNSGAGHSGTDRTQDQKPNDHNHKSHGAAGTERSHGNAGHKNTGHKNTGQKHMPERPKWVPPQIPSMVMPVPECPFCGKPIRDLVSALTDKKTGAAAHFDCIIARLAENEVLDKGDSVSYIGGGRFGIVHFNNPADFKKFIIKKIIEWENKDDRPEWRAAITDHFSVT